MRQLSRRCAWSANQPPSVALVAFAERFWQMLTSSTRIDMTNVPPRAPHIKMKYYLHFVDMVAECEQVSAIAQLFGCLGQTAPVPPATIILANLIRGAPSQGIFLSRREPWLLARPFCLRYRRPTSAAAETSWQSTSQCCSLPGMTEPCCAIL